MSGVGEIVRPKSSIPVLEPKSLVLMCPDCASIYEKKGLSIGDIRCETCGNHGDQMVLEVRRYEDVKAKHENVKETAHSLQPGPGVKKITEKNRQVDQSDAEKYPAWFTPTHHEILAIVRKEPGINTTTIAQRLKQDLTYVSGNLMRMVNAGFLEKQSDEKDARIKRYYVVEGKP